MTTNTKPFKSYLIKIDNVWVLAHRTRNQWNSVGTNQFLIYDHLLVDSDIKEIEDRPGEKTALVYRRDEMYKLARVLAGNLHEHYDISTSAEVILDAAWLAIDNFICSLMDGDNEQFAQPGSKILEQIAKVIRKGE